MSGEEGLALPSRSSLRINQATVAAYVARVVAAVGEGRQRRGFDPRAPLGATQAPAPVSARL